MQQQAVRAAGSVLVLEVGQQELEVHSLCRQATPLQIMLLVAQLVLLRARVAAQRAVKVVI